MTLLEGLMIINAAILIMNLICIMVLALFVFLVYSTLRKNKDLKEIITTVTGDEIL